MLRHQASGLLAASGGAPSAETIARYKELLRQAQIAEAGDGAPPTPDEMPETDDQPPETEHKSRGCIDKEHLREMIERGVRPSDIASTLDVTRQTVTRAIKRLREATPRPQKKRKDPVQERIKELAHLGWTPKQIAHETGIRHSSACRAVKRLRYDTQVSPEKADWCAI